MRWPYDKKITNKALWDKNFQNKILNTSNNWEVDVLVNLGYYPWLKLNDCIDVYKRQNYIYNVKVEAYSKAGGICGKAIEIASGIYNNLINVDILVKMCIRDSS